MGKNKEKGIKSIQIRKKDVKLFLFIDNMILCHVKSSVFKNSKDSTNNRTKKKNSANIEHTESIPKISLFPYTKKAQSKKEILINYIKHHQN